MHTAECRTTSALIQQFPGVQCPPVWGAVGVWPGGKEFHLHPVNTDSIFFPEEHLWREG